MENLGNQQPDNDETFTSSPDVRPAGPPPAPAKLPDWLIEARASEDTVLPEEVPPLEEETTETSSTSLLSEEELAFEQFMARELGGVSKYLPGVPRGKARPRHKKQA